MKYKFSVKILANTLFILLAAIFLTTGFLLFIYNSDNKYTKKAQTMQDESISLIPESGYCFLVDGWELYPDLLLYPEDFENQNIPVEPYHTWVGEYPSLAALHGNNDPYGTSTYRLKLSGRGMKSLYLPEPLCASRVYLNGKLLGGTGDLSSEIYRPLVRDSVYSFSLDSASWLIIQTANYSHYYGGLYYPPAIGEPDAISRMVNLHILFYGALCSCALSLALFCAVLWGGRKKQGKDMVFYFGLLCLSFSVWISYPLLRMTGIPHLRSLYALQDMSSMLCLYCSIRITALLFLSKSPAWIKQTASILALGMCILTVILPLFFLPGFPAFIPVYGYMISWYKLLASLFLVGSAVYGTFHRTTYAGMTLFAVTANGFLLAAGVVTINIIEPAAFGWPDEYGAFLMVMAFAAVMVRQNHAVQTQNLHLTSHLKEEVKNQTKHLDLLLKERGQLMAELGHDLKSPLTSLSNMAQIIRQNNIFLDQDTKDNMQVIENECFRMAERLRSLQEFSVDTKNGSTMEPLSLNHFISEFYTDHKSVVELSGPDFICKITPYSCTILGNPLKLERALENLVFNAGDFTPPEGKIILSLNSDAKSAYICVKDDGCGISEENLTHIFNHFFTTRADEGGQGLGLSIVRDIILEHNGTITAESGKGPDSLFTICLPLLEESQSHSEIN